MNVLSKQEANTATQLLSHTLVSKNYYLPILQFFALGIRKTLSKKQIIFFLPGYFKITF